MGKTHAAVIELSMAALREKGVYAYIAPEKGQGERAMWMKAEEILRDIPGMNFNKAKSYITFPNGSILHILGGASGPERIRGIHPKGMIIDEVADLPHDFWWGSAYGSLQVHKGWCLFIGTPKGEDLFFDLYRNLGLNPEAEDWDAIKIDVHASGLFTPAEIEKMAKDTPKDQWDREFLCMFTGTLGGSYYNQIINEMWERGKIGHYPYQTGKPVIAAFDLGLVDKTAVWFAQLDPSGDIRVIDFFEETNEDTFYWTQLLRSKPYNYHEILLPHDAKKRSTGTKGHSPREIFINHGFRVRDIPKTNSLVADIAAVRSKIYTCVFDDNSDVLKGIAHLRGYESSRDKMTGEFSPEPKSKSSHRDAADAFRYLVLGWKTPEVTSQIPEQLEKYSPMQHGLNKRNGFRLHRTQKHPGFRVTNTFPKPAR
jgi:phage terminase large subunit